MFKFSRKRWGSDELVVKRTGLNRQKTFGVLNRSRSSIYWNYCEVTFCSLNSVLGDKIDRFLSAYTSHFSHPLRRKIALLAPAPEL